jgi:purine-binding chemotaxis protein CheW
MEATPKGHLVFACGESLYALPADKSAEVVSLAALTRVPGAPAHLLGVFAHRGEVVPVVDLAVLTGGKAEKAYRRAVLMRVPRGVLAFTASKVAGVSQVTGDQRALGAEGVQAHLKGPTRTHAGDAAIIEPEGLFDFLSGGR